MTSALIKSGVSWCSHSWGIAVGCTNDCSWQGKSYCYARSMKRRFSRGCEDCAEFEPHLHPEKFDNYPKPLKNGKSRSVFVAPCGGLWEPGAFSDATIQHLLDFIAEHPHDTFLTLTKNPRRYHDCFYLPLNMWSGVTITTEDQMFQMRWTKTFDPAIHKTFASFEPLLDNVAFDLSPRDVEHLKCAIIGPLNHRGKSPTKPEWIRDLMEVCERAGVRVHLKPQCESVGIPRDVIDAHQSVPWGG